VVQGRVTDVDDEEFTIDGATRRFRVDVEDLPSNPLDDQGYQQIEVGDVVSVIGEMDDDFLDGREIEADSVVTIHDFTSWPR
jgi:hypothetical protein